MKFRNNTRTQKCAEIVGFWILIETPKGDETKKNVSLFMSNLNNPRARGGFMLHVTCYELFDVYNFHKFYMLNNFFPFFTFVGGMN